MSERPVAVDDGETARNENLPYPIVKYPSHYGTFIGFNSQDDNDLYFCSCAREAIETSIRFEHRKAETASYSVSPKKAVEGEFPELLINRVQESGVDDIQSIIGTLKFQDRICHKCNDVVPNRRYCADMYGTVFEQNYGWYINQKQREYGIPKKTLRSEFSGEFLDCLPEDVIDIVDAEGKSEIKAQSTRYATLHQKQSHRIAIIRSIERAESDRIREKEQSGELSIGEARERRRELDDKYDTEQVLPSDEHEELNHLQNVLREYGNTIAEAAENEVRRAVGHYQKGSRWTSETILYQLVESLYGDRYTLKRHHRPDWLDGLELDIYIVEPGIGIEYQGVQHYEPIDHWGGDEGLMERQERDERTRKLCDQRGVEMVEFQHDEELSEELVRSKIEPIG